MSSALWDALNRIEGTDSRETLELVNSCARQCAGIVILIRPSIQVAVSAVLGVLQAPSIYGPTRVYIADFRLQHLKLLFDELRKMNVADEVTLYHGSLTQFLRDLPLRADLICADMADLDPAAAVLRSVVSAGIQILNLNRAHRDTGGAAPKYLMDTGMLALEAVGPGGDTYRATGRCQGAGFIPRSDSRIAVRSKLNRRYFSSKASENATHTPVADLTEEIRREFSREFPAASGS